MDLTTATARARIERLDNPAWHALTTLHARFAEGDALAKRYPATMSQIGAVRESTAEAHRSMAKLLGPGGIARLFMSEPGEPSPFFSVLEKFEVRQMIGPRQPPRDEEDDIQELTAADVPEMLRLIELTRPGPFGARTHEMGTYLGIRKAGRLVAMAGERLRLPGFTEISSVCTDPEHRGRGYARRLVSALARRIAQRDETAFLYVLLDNDPALRIYEKLGFETRRCVRIAVIRANPPESAT
jgi:predicted GNAT family acetyltransferase